MKRIIFVFMLLVLLAAPFAFYADADEEIHEKSVPAAADTSRNADALMRARERTAESFPKVLKKGMTGIAVRTLNHELLKLGYLEKEQNGVFTDETEAALKQFQTDRGMQPDGIAGEATVWEMFVKNL